MNEQEDDATELDFVYEDLRRAKDRIEALEEVCKRDRFADGYAAGCKDFQMVGGKRIEELEAALREIARNTCCHDKCQEAALVARAALAEEQDK